MSKYFRRRIDPKSRLMITLCLLLTGKSGEKNDFGTMTWKLPKTGQEIRINPHWITESD